MQNSIYVSGSGSTARSDPWKPKITFLAKTHLIGLGSVENVIFSYFDGI